MPPIAEKRVLHALDLDRTLVDTPTVSRAMLSILHEYDAVLSGEIENDLHETEARGESYQLYDRIAELLGPERMVEYKKRFLETVGPDDILLPGAQERLAFAKSRPGWLAGIFTFGSPEAQHLKLQAAGLEDEACLIVDNPDKGSVIASWVVDETEEIQLPEALGGEVVDVVVLDDDKRRAFEQLPAWCLGNWVSTVNDTTEIPENVAQVSSLYDSIERLEKL